MRRPTGPSRVVLVKHALPVLDSARPAREWRLGDEGRGQARRLAAALAPFAPFQLATSPEPKAIGTCEAIAATHGVPMRVVEGLRELDRPALPILSRDEHQRLNERLFVEFDLRVLGSESAREARDRFGRAMGDVIGAADGPSVVIVTHGTVISLFVAEHNEEVCAAGLWRSLECPSFVVLDGSFRLREIRARVS